MNWQNAINDYKIYLKLEKGKADNTIQSYVRDVEKLASFASQNPTEIDYEEVQQFVYEIAKTSIKERSQARLISALRSFFKFLVLDEKREDNPTELIDLPKLGLYLPDTLSESEITKIIQQIDLSHPQGERNRAMLETLYGCGLRVSELVNLKISDLFFNESFIRVLGKGSKERLIPIAKVTMKYINIYKDEVRIHQKVQDKYKDILFLNRNGKQLTRVMVFTIIKELVQKTDITKTISPHTFRHSFATHLLQNGADLRSIQLMLGHESIITTEIYTHIDAKDLQKTILEHHPRNIKNNS